MPTDRKDRKHHRPVRSGPIKPGTPLYRILQMIAKRIVDRSESESSHKTEGPPATGK